ncbi:MAG: protein phosphatase 2C domain-containing protein [Cryobacterium sp.]|nr:protein phosphatase 2C domain-containing protein [Oligoflexia bacterium]
MSRSPVLRSLTLFSTQGDHPLQEDFILAKKERGLFVIADGFGGGDAGGRASKVACESVLGFLEKEAGDHDATLPFVLRRYYSLAGNVLFNALIHANRKVFEHNVSKTANFRGGSSVLAAFLDEDLFALANIGGCSAWLMREGLATELVAPRTYARLVDPFSVDPRPDEAIPLMAMGMTEDLEPEVVEFRIRSGDWLLLQTDGVRAEIRDELQRLQLESPAFDPEEFLRARTFSDNSTFAFLRF